MKKILLIPCILFPYVLLFNVICIYTGFLMEEVFQNFILVMILYLFIYVIFVLICNISYILICRVNNVEAKEMAKANMIVKLAQIPGYVAVFVLGVICFFSIFTIGFTFFFVLYDCISIFLTGIIGFFAILQNKKENERLSTYYIISMILQFIFCVDVISSIILYFRIGIIKNEEREIERSEINLLKVSKFGLITYFGAIMFGTMLAISEVMFPDLDTFLNVNVWYDIFFYLSLGITLFGFIMAIIKKNKTNSSRKEYIAEIMVSMFSFIAILTGIIFSDDLLGRAVFSFGSGIFIINTLGFIQTIVGLHKNKKQRMCNYNYCD